MNSNDSGSRKNLVTWMSMSLWRLTTSSRRRFEIGDVGVHRPHAQQRHAPEQAADNRRRLVVGKIDAAGRQQQLEDSAKLLVGDGRSAFGLLPAAPDTDASRPAMTLVAMSDGDATTSTICVAIAARGMPSYFAVAGSCANVMPSIVLISRDAERAIRRRARQHDADRVRPERARERSKEEIDGVVLAPIGRPPAQVQMAVDELHLRVRRHDVHAIGRDAHALGRLEDGKRRMAGREATRANSRGSARGAGRR